MLKHLIKNKFTFVSLLLSLSIASFAQVEAKIAPFQPPAKNPHPPITKEEKQRIHFANLAVRKLLLSLPSKNEITEAPADLAMDESIDLQVTPACLEKGTCLSHHPKGKMYLDAIKSYYGQIVDFRHTHIIPWSFDQYLKNRKAKTRKESLQKPTMPEQALLSRLPTSTDPTLAAGASAKRMAEMSHADVAPMKAPEVGAEEYLMHTYIQLKNGSWMHMDIIIEEKAPLQLVLKRFFLFWPRAEFPPGVVC